MFKYSITIVFRKLLKGNRQLLLNVLGLSVAFAVVIFLSTFIATELKRGKSVENYQNLYRLSAEQGVYWSSRSIEEFTGRFPEIRGITKLHADWADKSYYEVDKNQYNAGKILYADNYFFDVFTYETIAGNLNDALAIDKNIILTETEAFKIFGERDVIGRMLRFRTSSFGEMDFTVAAVIKDLPPEAMMTFDAIIPVVALENNVPWYKSDHWGQSRYETFVSLISSEAKSNAENQFNAAFQSAAPDWARQDKGKIFLKPYSSLYFSEGQSDVLIHSSIKRVRILETIMIIVFLLALINFINLNTAQKIKQSRDVGIHKVLGASTWNSFARIITEILPILLITLFFASLIVAFALPFLNGLFGSSFRFSTFFQPNTLLTVLFTITATLFFSTIFISSYFYRSKLYEVLKSNGSGKKENLRNALLVVQFTLSVALIISSLVINKQNLFMQNQSMGFQKDNIVYIPLHDQMEEQAKSTKQELEGISEVTNITMASQPLGKSEMGWGMSLNNNGEEKRIEYEAMRVDKNFFNFFGIDIISGEGFRSSSVQENEHIFNETAIKTFGITNIADAHISSYDNASGEIIGVVKDFNFESLHHAIRPIGFVCAEPENLQIIYLNLQVINRNQLQATLKKVESVWNTFSNEWPFEYYFLDQTLDNLYKADRTFSKVFLLLTLLSVFIGSLGLFSTSIFIAEMRTKEIGIRKVNGAKIMEILAMLNKDFVKWVAVAFVIATPVAYYAMSKWLENFAYKTELSWWFFALAGLLALGIALLTVSWQSWRAATRNPVEALRYE